MPSFIVCGASFRAGTRGPLVAMISSMAIV
jgi:hypothetical protein